MRHTAIDTIQDEHQALAAMLRSLRLLVDDAVRKGTPPPFGVLRAMLFYVDEFPERLHHPKESTLLFPALRRRCPDLAPTLDRLDAEHRRGEAAVRELQHALTAWELLGAPRQDAFLRALERYIDGYLAHMATEEGELLPAARSHLEPADWAALDAAFAANRDPLAGHAADAEFQPLFTRIVNEAPAPIGLRS